MRKYTFEIVVNCDDEGWLCTENLKLALTETGYNVNTNLIKSIKCINEEQVFKVTAEIEEVILNNQLERIKLCERSCCYNQNVECYCTIDKDGKNICPKYVERKRRT